MRMFNSSTGQIVLLLLVVFHVFIWYGKIETPSGVDYGVAVTALMALWRHKKVTDIKRDNNHEHD